MFNLNCFLFAFSVFATTLPKACQHTCHIEEKSSTAICKTLDNVFPQDDGKFSKYVCGCATAILTSNVTTCHANQYDFKAAPHCRTLFTSDEFKKATTKSNLLSNFVNNVIFRIIFGACKRNEDQASSLVYTCVHTGSDSREVAVACCMLHAALWDESRPKVAAENNYINQNINKNSVSYLYGQ
uniref:Uncharacterized protein n=1 Tax=Strigamia maritima TaxID=126957 RepID=T1IWN5_STRMM